MDPVKTAGVPAHPWSQEPSRAEAAPRPRRLDPPKVVTIGEIQGADLRSPLDGQRVTTTGVVTAVRSTGFYLQAEKGESAPGSRAVWVFTGRDMPNVAIGDKVTVTGDVKEFKFDTSPQDQPTTELAGRLTMMIVARGLNLDAAVGTPRRIGKDGLVQPNIKAVDAIKFYEGIEGERVTIKDLLVVGPTSFGKFVVVTDGGSLATRITKRGTLIASTDDDVHPEAIAVKVVSGRADIIDDIEATPKLKVGDRIPGEVTGILTYDRGQFVLETTALPAITEAPAYEFKTSLKASDTEMLVASVNCENLDPTDGVKRFDLLAGKIVKRYGSPDIVALQEIQDDDGPADTGNVSGKLTGKMLCDAIERAGGPKYTYVEIAPVNNAEGGEPGGNIRVAYLVRTDRMELDEKNLRRIGEGDPAFQDTRKSLELHATFKPTGKKVVLINDHFSSKGGSDPVYGERQPPQVPTHPKRVGQQLAGHKRMVELGKQFPDAAIGSIGDKNWTPGEAVRNTEASLRSKIVNVSAELPDDAGHSYIFMGGAQNIDQLHVHVGTKAKLEVDDSNTHLWFGHPDRDADHGHLLALFDMRVQAKRGRRAGASRAARSRAA